MKMCKEPGCTQMILSDPDYSKKPEMVWYTRNQGSSKEEWTYSMMYPGIYSSDYCYYHEKFREKNAHKWSNRR